MGQCRGSAKARKITGEEDSGEFCKQTGMGRRTCRDTKHAYREGDISGQETDEA